MTIAIGCIAKDGILLCSDTLYSDGFTRQYGPKIFSFAGNGLSASIAVAGNATIGKMAAMDCITEFHDLDWDQRTFSKVFGTVRGVVQRLQHDYVDKVPIEERERSRFYLLVGLHTEISGYHLYASNDAALAPVFEFDCIGSGRQIGIYTIEPSYRRDLSLNHLSILALNALSSAKERVEGVGGDSNIVMIRNGAVSEIFSYQIDRYEGQMTEYRRACSRLLLEMAEPTSTREFEAQIEHFVDEIKFRRANFMGGNEPWRALEEWITKLEAKSRPQLPKGDQSPAPTSPEPRDRSSES